MTEPILITIKSYNDNRGTFYESYTDFILKEYNITTTFIQDCHSISHKNVIRGLHYQWNEPLDKLIRVSNGSVIDVLVDIRHNSINFGKVYYYELNSKNLNQLWAPAGFAHGFISLEDNTHVQYKFTKKYNKFGENGINPFDETLNIKWGIPNNTAVISEKDKALQSFNDYRINFKF